MKNYDILFRNNNNNNSNHCFLAVDEREEGYPPSHTITRKLSSFQHSALMVLNENERIFTELLRTMERKYNEVKEMIHTHERTTVTQAEMLLDRLEEEITLLRKKHNDLEKLSHTDDHIHFLQVSPSVGPWIRKPPNKFLIFSF